MTTTGIAVLVLVLAGAAVIAYLLSSASRGRRLRDRIPPGMRPAYADEQLEKSVLERYMGWGLVMTMFFAIFLPIYGVAEARRIEQNREGFYASSVVRGGDLYIQNCSLCHAADLSGGFASSPYSDDPWPAPALDNVAARYEGTDVITDIDDFLETTIRRGRPGTPMPVWGSEFDGPLNDQQIRDIVEFILANQVDRTEAPATASNVSGEDLFTQNCARCHGAEMEGQVGPTLIGVFERHARETVLGIMQNGIRVPGAPIMPPWENGYMYEDGRLSTEALERIIDYLEQQQPEEIPDRLRSYQGPGMTLDEAQTDEADQDTQEASARRRAGV